jgi:hypothetical protein
MSLEEFSLKHSDMLPLVRKTLRQMTHRRKSNFIGTPKVRSLRRKSFRREYV